MAGTLAFFANLALTRWRFLPFGISIVFIAIILSAVHRTFMRKIGEDASMPAETDVNDATIILSLRICFGLAIALLVKLSLAITFDLMTSEIMPTIILGLAKAASWFFLLRTVYIHPLRRLLWSD